MTSTLGPPDTVTTEPALAAPVGAPIDRAAGIELLGEVSGSGYSSGAALVRRADGQMVQLGPLLYSVLEAADGRKGNAEIAADVTERIGRRVDEQHVERIAEKLATQGLLAGSEAAAPPRRNPLLALRWRVLVTNPRVTRALTAPFTFLFRPWIMWPVVAAFGGVCWFVLFHKGLAGPGAQAFHRPGLLLLIFAIGIVSAGFHELGHAAACRYGGASPGGMGMGLYLVWPAFYTDVTDAYRLDRRSRLRVDLAGLYFNAVIAVVITAVWLAVRVDALLLAVALQLLLMVKQLSPVIRADGYHILADATGVPDLFAHLGPTLRRLVPGAKRCPSALTGKARALVTVWVLVMVPVLLSLMAGAVLLLPRLATSAWDSGRAISQAIPQAAGHGQILSVGADLLRLVALVLPVLGSALIAQRLLRALWAKARAWSAGRPVRRAGVVATAAAVVAAMVWAWWPAGQYQPVRSTDHGTLPSLVSMISSPTSVARPAPALLPPGRYVALAMVPVTGASPAHPALLVVRGATGHPVGLLSDTNPLPASATSGSVATTSSGPSGSTPAPDAPGPSASPLSSTSTGDADGSESSLAAPATAFPFTLPAAPGPGDTQALATNTTDGGTVYKVGYAVVTVADGAPVTNTNSAFALASCSGCSTVAVSFQVILVVGESHEIAPINAAGALNVDCPACTTTAIADQLVVTLTAAPSQELEQRLEATLSQLDNLPSLGADPAAIASEVDSVQAQVEDTLRQSGLLAAPLPTASPSVAATSGAATPTQQAPFPTKTPSASPSSSPTAARSPSPSDSPAANASPQTSSPASPSSASSPTSSP
ncbi:MAG TPA: hypothetical protein VHC43_04455 [Mycobacteriales bacterium]|nr:hypothetical protein [Mycobacteriales bacterium]